MRLISAIDQQQGPEADLIASGLGLDVTWVSRTEPVSFRYFTPVSPPVINGRMAQAEALNAEDEIILVFGMVECPIGRISASGTWIVVDPQQPRDLTDLDLSNVKADHLAIVANAREIKALGRDADVGTAAKTVARKYGAEVVVTKLAARGALVTTDTDQAMVGAFPTEKVWPIGSGDVFAAGFSSAWGNGASPVDAARSASRAAAAWSANPRDDYDIGRAESVIAPELDPSRTPHVYLAAPFFTLSQRWLVHLIRDVLEGLGAEVFSPFHDVGPGGIEVAELDLAGLRDCSSVLGVIDGSDPGTVFETGFATALGLPVVCYAEQENTEVWKMLAGTGAEFHSDLSSALYRSVWAGMKNGE